MLKKSNMLKKGKELTREEKEQELMDIQLRESRMRIKQMESQTRDEKKHKVLSAVKRAGTFAMKTLTPTNTTSSSEYNRRATRYPSEMFDASKAFGGSRLKSGNSAPTRSRKIKYVRRVR